MVRKPKDKPHVERDVQTVREMFKEELALNPSINLYQLNEKALHWLVEKYGQRSHSTTGQKPYQMFSQLEKPHLLSLLANDFSNPTWKKAKVHPDCFVQYNKQFFSVPHRLVGELVWIKAISRILTIYYKEQIVKTHLITNSIRQTDYRDFPDNYQHILDPNLEIAIRIKAKETGQHFEMLISKLFENHAFLNLRRIMALNNLIEKYSHESPDKVAQIFLQRNESLSITLFKALLEQYSKSSATESIPIGQKTEAFVRDTQYFFNT